jgi:hypothetical protein
VRGTLPGGSNQDSFCSQLEHHNPKMGLHQLAAELRLAIAELLDPRTCFKLALASRDDHRLYSSMLVRYKTLFTRYNTIDTCDAGRLVWDVTREIIEEPSLAYFIEDISLPDRRQTVWEADTDLDMFRHRCRALLPEDDVQLYAEAARKIPVIDEAMQDCAYDPWFHGPNWDMEQSIRIGTDEPITALLVAMATNLRTLRFTEYNERNEWPSVMKNIARAYLYPTSPPSTLPLQHLKYVAISYADTEMCCSADWAEIFPTLPSLVGFAARKMGGSLDSWREERGEDEPDDYVGKSNVKDMLFDWSFFNPEALVQIISGPAALKSFFYTNGGSCVSDEGCFASRKITAALVKYHAESLENLTFEGEDDEDVSCGKALLRYRALITLSSAVITTSQAPPLGASRSYGRYVVAGAQLQAMTMTKTT